MLSRLINFLWACWRPSSDRVVHTGSDAVGRQDGLLWFKDTGQHVNGEFSMAVVQANNLLEDESQIESGPLSTLESGPYGTFVGVYDGHGGPETSRYINSNLFPNLKRFASEHQSMSTDVIKKAFQATEEGFFSVVTKQWPSKPQIAAVGSCCLVGVICSGTLYIANLGDSRAVLGRLVKATGEVLSVQLSAEHNASIESVRQELYSMHPDDSHIVMLKHNVWRVKGLIQTTETILLERCLNGLESSRALNCALLEIMAAKAKIPLGKVWLPYVQQGTSFQAPARYWRELLQSHLSVLDCLKLKLKMFYGAIPFDRRSARNHGFAFVPIATTREADRAIDLAIVSSCCGRNIQVNFSQFQLRQMEALRDVVPQISKEGQAQKVGMLFLRSPRKGKVRRLKVVLVVFTQPLMAAGGLLQTRL